MLRRKPGEDTGGIAPIVLEKKAAVGPLQIADQLGVERVETHSRQGSDQGQKFLPNRRLREIEPIDRYRRQCLRGGVDDPAPVDAVIGPRKWVGPRLDEARLILYDPCAPGSCANAECVMTLASLGEGELQAY